MKVENLNKKSILDLIDSTCSHYLVTDGDMKFYVSTGEKLLISKKMTLYGYRLLQNMGLLDQDP